MFSKIRRYNLLYSVGIVAFLISMFLFLRITQKLFLSSLLSILFVAMLGIGARFENWISLFTNRKHANNNMLPNWTTAALFTVTVFYIIGLISSSIPVSLLMFTVAILLNAVYALAKIRCWILGCCSSEKYKFPVQVIESIIYLGFAVLLIALKDNTKTGMVVFAFFYPLSRFYFHSIKQFAISRFFIFANITIAIIYGISGFQSIGKF